MPKTDPFAALRKQAAEARKLKHPGLAEFAELFASALT
jgi:hypothetical protein